MTTKNPFHRENAPRKVKPVVASEDAIQAKIIKWAKGVNFDDRPLADYIHHSPNGGVRNRAEGAKFKAMGVKAGYPDLIIDIAAKGFHGLRIELKKELGGKVSKVQNERLALLSKQGYKAVVCRGFDEAIKTISDYVG